jgi:hypothetical protein
VFSQLLPSQLNDMLPVLFPAGSAPTDVPPLATGVVGARAHFPLQIAHCTEYVRPRVALIGWVCHLLLCGMAVVAVPHVSLTVWCGVVCLLPFPLLHSVTLRTRSIRWPDRA